MTTITNSTERSFKQIFSGIFTTVEDLVRGEVRLAKAEVREKVARARLGAGWLAVSLLGALFAAAFFLWAIFFALLYAVAPWASALIVAVVLAFASAAAWGVRIRIIRKFEHRQSVERGIEERLT